MNDPYEVLGVKRDATPDEIKKAYRAKSLENHPDQGGDEELFKEISAAYRILSSPEERFFYDSHGYARGDKENPMARALQFIEAAFLDILQHNRKCNVIDQSLKVAEEAKRQLHNDIVGENRKLDKWNRYRNRVVLKNNAKSRANIFENILSAKIAEAQSRIEMLEAQMETIELSIPLLREYTDANPEEDGPKTLFPGLQELQYRWS